MAAIPKEALDEYIGETREMCGRVSLNLALVEQNQHEHETLKSIYRDMHSIKGSSHLFGFGQIGELAHAMETALDPIREKNVPVDAETVDVLYAGLDLIAKMLQSIITNGGEDLSHSAELTEITPRILAIGAQISEKREPAIPLSDHARPDRRGRAMSDDFSPDTGTLRIQVGILDHLMNLIGELVLVRNQVLQYSNRQVTGDLQKIAQRLNVVTSEIQLDVMKTRMQPISHILTQFPRLVRDTSRELGKHVTLKIEGAETELDKALIEAVKDPLTHVVRNSLDHGLERPDDRKKSGKSETGQLHIRSYHDGGQVVIEVSDDGRGLSKMRIGRKAVEQGIISEEQLAKITEREVQALIFVPGFSTVDKVSNISGRGVGMDIVKTNIERIGGSVDVQSGAGLGTTVRLKIPLTLAIVPAIMVDANGQYFAIPQAKIIELIHVENRRGEGRTIEMLQGKAVLRLRGDILPLVDLAAALGLRGDNSCRGGEGQETSIVLVKGDSGPYGLIVDGIVDSSDIVIKPAVQNLKRLGIYSGATILGDGSVVLILDVADLYKKVSCSGNHGSAAALNANHASSARENGRNQLTDSCDYLLVETALNGRYIMPLCMVHRLEEFSTAAIQRSGNVAMVKYRDGFLPLIDLGSVLSDVDHPAEYYDSSEFMQVVVISKLNRFFGVVVKQVSDVLRASANIDCHFADRPGIMGSMLHDGKIFSVIDVHTIIDVEVQKLVQTPTTDDEFLRQQVQSNTSNLSVDRHEQRSRHKILLAEDTMFFRRHVKNFLESQGYEVVAVSNGDEAIRSLDGSKARDYSLLITDIEMPVIDGLELTKLIRARHDLRDFPIVALSTKFKQVDIDRGAEAGVTKYIEKLNRDELLANIDHLMGIDQFNQEECSK
jgi:two-component system chemotaxis sensor kinase CheA